MRSGPASLLALLLAASPACHESASPAPAPRPADLALAVFLSGGPATDAALARLAASAGVSPPEGWRDPTGQGLVTLLGFLQLARHERSPSVALLATPDADELIGWMRGRGRLVSCAGGRAVVRRAATSPHAVYSRGSRALAGEGLEAWDAATEPDLELVFRQGLAAASLGPGVEDGEAAWGIDQAADVQNRAGAAAGAGLRILLAPEGIQRWHGAEGDLAGALRGVLGPADPGALAWLDAAAGLLAECAMVELEATLAGEALSWAVELEARPGTALAGRLAAGLEAPAAVLGPGLVASLAAALPGWDQGVAAAPSGERRVRLAGSLSAPRLGEWLGGLSR